MSRPPSRRTDAYFTPNPFYEGAGTLVLIDRVTARRQHMAIWPPMPRTEFLQRARHHLRVMNDPYPEFTPPPFRHKREARSDRPDPIWE